MLTPVAPGRPYHRPTASAVDGGADASEAAGRSLAGCHRTRTMGWAMAMEIRRPDPH